VTFAKIQTVFELGYHYKQTHFKHGFHPHNPLHLLTVIKLTLHFHSQTRHKSNMHNTQKKQAERKKHVLCYHPNFYICLACILHRYPANLDCATFLLTAEILPPPKTPFHTKQRVNAEHR